MVEPSRRRAAARLRLSAWRRARQLAAAGLCAASFFAGQLLQGQLLHGQESTPPPAPAYLPQPQTIVNQFVTGAPAAAQAQPAASKSQSPAAAKTVVAANHQVEPAASANWDAKSAATAAPRTIANPLVPAAITAAAPVEPEPLPAILTPAEARPLKNASLYQPAAEAAVPSTTGPKLIEAVPLPLAPQSTTTTAPASTTKAKEPVQPAAAEESLAPIVSATSMPRRPGEKREAPPPAPLGEPKQAAPVVESAPLPQPRPLAEVISSADLREATALPTKKAAVVPAAPVATTKPVAAQAPVLPKAEAPETLAPIVAPPKATPAQTSAPTSAAPAVTTAAPPAWMQEVRAALEASKPARQPQAPSPAAAETPQTKPAAVQQVQFTQAAPRATAPRTGPQLQPMPRTPARATERRPLDDAELFTAQPPAEPAAPAPLPEGVAASPLPAGSPFEAIPESGTIALRVRRSLLMRTKTDIYRTAVVDEGVCDIVQFTPREISLIGRSQGSTHITFWFDDPAQPPLTYLVKVEPDAALVEQVQHKYQLLEDLVNEMFPDSKIRLVVLADKLLVKGQARDAEEAAQIMTIVRTQGQGYNNNNNGGLGMLAVGDAAASGVIPAAAAGELANQPTYQIVNMLRIPGVQQVALRVKIAELNRSAARGFGVDVETNINFGDAANGSKLLLASILNAGNSATGGGTSVIADISGDDATVGIRYLQQRGVIRLLSEPTLVTLSGKPATFVAGGEFAVPTVVGSVGLNAVTTDFRAFGAIISFLPTVLDKDRVRLQVAPEFSQINNQLAVNGTPGLNVRSATTTVEMREGQTLAIAGLLEDSYKATNVGNLPFLAQIFGRRDASRSETELIILVTPELVHPMEPEEVPPLPGFDVTEPTNGEFFLHGQLEGHPSREYRSTVWPRLRKRYGGPAMMSGPFGHGQ
ncbi:MAG: pilus assembly protein N-terminal domain-containing protein [Pirellulaceae bacterium]|nr:pilus assembly protein N-terminal domain-containing protein [Pirellulaceae bacterium]